MHEKLNITLDYIMKNKDWIFSGIGISILGIIFWPFKDKVSKSHQSIKNGNENQQITEAKQSQTSGNQSTNIQVLGGQTNIYGISEEQLPQIIKSVTDVILAQYPIAQQNAQRNMSQFSMELNPKLSKLTIPELQNLEDPDIVSALMQSMREAARTDEREVHQVLSEVVIQRMKLGKTDIKKLAFNQAIEATLKLDSNLLKTLSALFFITYVRRNGYFTLDKCIEFNSQYFKYIVDITISNSSVAYLESIGCGSPQPFSSGRVGEIILNQYKNLFFFELPSSELNTLQLRDELKKLLFQQSNEKYLIDTAFLYVLEYGFEGISFNGPNAQNIIKILRSITEEEKKYILNFVKKYRMNADEVEKYFLTKIPQCKNLIELLKLSKNIFRLTPVGSAIALSFWKSKGKELDVNVWIN